MVKFFFGKKNKEQNKNFDAIELSEKEVPEDLKKEQVALANKVMDKDQEIGEVPEKVITDVLSDFGPYERFTTLKDSKTVDFRTEEFEFKKFILTFEKEGIPFAVKDLQLANIKYNDIRFMSDVLSFASQLYVNGAVNTAKFFFEKILYYLHLSVSVDGFGRKELSTIRQISASETKEEPKKGFQLIR